MTPPRHTAITPQGVAADEGMAVVQEGEGVEVQEKESVAVVGEAAGYHSKTGAHAAAAQSRLTTTLCSSSRSCSTRHATRSLRFSENNSKNRRIVSKTTMGKEAAWQPARESALTHASVHELEARRECRAWPVVY